MKKRRLEKFFNGQQLSSTTMNDMVNAINNLYDLIEKMPAVKNCPCCGAGLVDLKCDYCGTDFNLSIE